MSGQIIAPDLNELLANAGDVVSVHDIDGHFLHITPSMQTLTGHDPAALLGQDARDLAHADDRDHVSAALTSVLTGTPFRVEWRCRRSDGDFVWLESRASLVATGTGDRIVTISRDIEERVRAATVLSAANARMATLGQTLAGVAHELNNPLTSIKGFAQVLLRNDDLSSEDREALEIVNREAARAATIVRDLLAYARRQEGAPRVPVQLNDVVRYVTSAHRYGMQARGIECIVELDPLLPATMGDSVQLEQVVLNLLMNARQALESQLDAGASVREQPPAVTLVTSNAGGCVRLEVRDTGPGIPAADLPQIWDPFWTTKDTGNGTGLGLSIVQGIVLSHDGDVRANSAPGEGTSIVVTLPPAIDVAIPPSVMATPLDILLLQHDSPSRDFLTRYLASRGHAVVVATNVDEAVTLATRGQFDVVICEADSQGTPDMPRRISGVARGHARLVATTHRPLDAPERAELERLGISALIESPVEIELLRRAVEGHARLM